MGCVYQAKNKINGMCYIGKTIQTLDIRKHGHRYYGRGTHSIFVNAVKKYGLEGFDWTVLLESDNDTLLCWFEQYCIKTAQTKSPYGYNLTDGGEGLKGRVVFDDTRKKMSLVHKGKPKSLEHRQKISKSNTGKHQSEETKLKISNSLKGKHPSEETRQKLSQSQKKRVYKSPSVETRQKISNSLKGKRPSEITRKKLSESQINRWNKRSRIVQYCEGDVVL